MEYDCHWPLIFRGNVVEIALRVVGRSMWETAISLLVGFYYEIDGKRSCICGVVVLKDVPFVVYWNVKRFNGGPERLQIAVEEKRIQMATWGRFFDE